MKVKYNHQDFFFWSNFTHLFNRVVRLEKNSLNALHVFSDEIIFHTEARITFFDDVNSTRSNVQLTMNNNDDADEVMRQTTKGVFTPKPSEENHIKRRMRRDNEIEHEHYK